MSDSSIDDAAPGDIAIVGVALRVPGAQNANEFWNNLRDGVESIRTLEMEELIAAGEKPERARRKNYVARAADLAGMEMFDADFFGLSPKDAAIMDPQHRQFLECTWEAFEDAGRPPETIEGPVGVFAGCGMGSYFYFNVCSHRDLVDQVGMFLLRHTGNDKDFLSTRVSHLLNLRGPSINIQTACSTSLVAVHYACMSLLNGECDAAIAGGSTIELPHRRGYLFQEGEILSPDGHCRAFDHRAQGTVFGSGTGVVVLKRLADALADGDPIRAVIKATAVNNDGSSKAGYLAPSVTGQAEAVVEAMGLAGLGADDIQYIECHGTGTYLGDPIEIEALTQAYRKSTTKTGVCRVGSVKTNIGHLDTAAGVVGLIKAVLSLENAKIPPTLGFEKPNPAIDFASSPFTVAERLEPWPATSGPRRAAVNSLGVGGTNAHAIIEEAPKHQARAETAEARKPHVLVLSAKSRKALDAAGKRLAMYLEDHPQERLSDVAHTLFTGRRHFEHRRVAAVADRADAITALTESTTSRFANQSQLPDVSGAVFLFPGGGAQYPGMARDLYRESATFRAAVDEGLSYLPADAAKEIREAWIEAGPDDEEAARRLLQPSMQLPAILIVEIAISRLWMEHGVRPSALIGHSMGQNAAACIAGVLSFEHAVQLVRLRGELFDEIKGGGMLSVALPYAELSKRLPAQLDIASVNAPDLCVVSGGNDDLEAFRQTLTEAGVETNRVPIDIAAHSRALAPILERFEAFLRSIPLKRPGIPIVSNRSGDWLTDSEATDPAYWVKHLRSTVHFADGLATLADDPARIYIEVGPGRALSSLVKAQGRVGAERVINSLPHPDERIDDHLHFLTSVARSWAAGLTIETNRLWPSAEARRIALPTYAFQQQRYFLDAVEPSQSTEDVHLTKHADMASWGWRPTWMQSRPATHFGADRKPVKWLLFLDEAGVGDAITQRLSSLGHDVVTVAMGDSYAKLSDHAYMLCAEHGREGYDALIQDLARQGELPTGIVHLGLLTRDERHRPGSSFFDRLQERGFTSLLHLAQALGDAGVAAPIQITVMTNGMLSVGDEPLPYPAKATVLGPAQVIPRELPGVSVRVIDIPLATRDSGSAGILNELMTVLPPVFGRTERPDDIAAQIWDDLFAENGNEIVAYREQRRWTKIHEPYPLPQDSAEPRFRENGVYLLTGGLGELGLLFARDLARNYKARLVLVGRSSLPDRSEWDRYLAAYGKNDRIGRTIAAIQEIEESGGKVHVATADVTNLEAMANVVAEARAKFGPINGVLHTAGVVRDNLIALKTPSEAQEVLAPKVIGTMVLDQVLKDEPLDLIVLFSSTSSDIAPAGQVDYVAANAYLNAYADSRNATGGPRVVSVHWGIWKDVGLAARALSAGDHAATPDDVQPTQTPLFDRKRGEPSQELKLEARWDTDRFWILGEHRLASGRAVWPGTGYLETAAEALVEAGLNGPFELEDLMFQRPLGVPEDEACNVRVTLGPDGDAYRFRVQSEVPLTGGVGLLTHADARVRRIRTSRPQPVDISALNQRIDARIVGTGTTPIPSSQEQHLNFGPRWKVLHSVRYGNGEALAHLRLDEMFAQDIAAGYRLHPALMDIATGFAMELIPGYSADDGLWVPMSYGRVMAHQTLPAHLVSHVRLETSQQLGTGYASFDVTLMDENGNVLVQIERFMLKHIGTAFDVDPSDVSDAVLAGEGTKTAAGDTSPALARLAAQIEQGIEPEEGFAALSRALAAGQPQIVVSSMDLLGLQKAAGIVDTAQKSQSAFERPDLDEEFVAPRNDIEETLAGYWSELLGVEKIGVHDSFFDLGGHSLIAVRLFRMIKKAYATDLPISVLFEAPTIAQCAELIAAQTSASETATDDRPSEEGAEDSGAASRQPAAARRFAHLVQTHPGKNALRTPFFICAGMFGNVLNLRHLAEQIGQDRAVYGLQARGLFGEQEPHETFEEMARDYLAEVRHVQPSGPYLLGGFSGGGLVAYEMARQLVEAGETVDLVVLLDTPFPEHVSLSPLDRISMKIQDFKREGVGYLIDWVRNRIAWEKSRRQKRTGGSGPAAEEFHNEAIEAAFRRALGRYEAGASAWPVLLLRPRLDIRYRLSGGRQLNIDRDPMHPDNGWSPYAADLTIIEVPGDHDSMVLEPNVRVLAGHLRRALNAQTVRTAVSVPAVALPTAAE